MNEMLTIKPNTIKEIFNPILEDIYKVKKEVVAIIDEAFENEVVTLMILKKIFNSTGKLLRPALVILSAKAVCDNMTEAVYKSVIKLAASVELIHNASLVHDDIIDDSDYRRNKLAVHKQYNNRIAVLAGDLLYTSALSILSKELNSKILINIVNCIQSMASTEIFCLSRQDINFNEYIKIIIGKTALFMSSCCETGAMLGCNDKQKIMKLKKFGMNFGIAYQLIDDFKDQDIKEDFTINGVEKAKEYVDSAVENIKFIENKKIKNSFAGLAAYTVNISS